MLFHLSIRLVNLPLSRIACCAKFSSLRNAHAREQTGILRQASQQFCMNFTWNKAPPLKPPFQLCVPVTI